MVIHPNKQAEHFCSACLFAPLFNKRCKIMSCLSLEPSGNYGFFLHFNCLLFRDTYMMRFFSPAVNTKDHIGSKAINVNRQLFVHENLHSYFLQTLVHRLHPSSRSMVRVMGHCLLTAGID